MTTDATARILLIRIERIESYKEWGQRRHKQNVTIQFDKEERERGTMHWSTFTFTWLYYYYIATLFIV